MNDFELEDPVHLKEQHSEIFTLRSITSQEQLLEVVPLYHKNDASEQYKSGHWSAKEHIKYIMFIDFFSDIFTIKHNKKLWKIFTIMSAFIKTRNSSQCRSHHQKNQRKHKSIEEILDLQRSRYKNYSTQFEKMKKVLRKLPIHNPIEVDNQKSTTALIPSIKVLEQNLDYHVYKNPISMKDIEISKKDLKQIKNRNSQKLITITKEKYIGSEVSIEMEDESEEGYNERVRSLYVNEMDNEQRKQKNIWNYGSSGIDSSTKKDEKLDKTADSYMDEGIKNLIKNNMKPALNPVKESENSDAISQDIVQNVRNYINIVQMKKTRSSLPSFEDFALDGEEVARLGQRLRNSKKESGNSQGKCKTLPPRSVKIESSEQSWPNSKKEQQKSIRKSLFSGFISSSLQEGPEVHQKYFSQNNYQSFGNFTFQHQFHTQNQQMMDFRRPESLPEGNYAEPAINLLYCDDFYKAGEYENSMPYSDLNMFRHEKLSQKQPELQRLDSGTRNFTKKRSRQPQSINYQKQLQEMQKPQRSQQQKKTGFNEACQSSQQFNTQSQNLPSSSNQLIPSLQNPYQLPQIPYFLTQNPVMQIPSMYNNYWFVPQQYPLLEYKLYKFIEFFIYFMINRIMTNNFYFPIQ